jgi:hypothetical protein
MVYVLKRGISFRWLDCHRNQITNLNLSENQNLLGLYCGYNLLESLDISNNMTLGRDWEICFMFLSGNACISLCNMPSLKEVCVWEGFAEEGPGVDTTGSPNICFQTDCNGDCSIVGIEENCNSELLMYPNPTNEMLTIGVDDPGLYSIEITSLNGLQIFGVEMNGSTHQIDFSTYHKGIYFVTVRSKDFVSTKKIIKL